MPGAIVRLPRPQRWQFIATATIGLAVSTALALLVWRADEARARAAFNEIAQQRISQATEHLHAALQDLVALRALFSTTGVVDRAQFDTYCAPLLSSDPAIQALEWIPAVSFEQRAAYERRARADGHPAFAFTAQTAQGMRPERPRPQYYPVYYVSPYRGNEKALGFDLASNPARQAALQTSAATGEMVATSRIVLVQAQQAGYGFLVFYPVYAKGGAAPAAPIGFVLGVFKVAHIVAPKHGATPPRHARVRLAVYDITEQAAGAPGSELYPKDAAPDLDAVRRDDLVYADTLEVGGRRWQLVAYRAPSTTARVEAGVVFAVAMLATLLILALMRQTMLARDSEAARELAARADATKSQFLANVSHEMRTPLNGVIGMLDLLLQSSLRGDQTRMAEISRRSAVNLLGIINDLLDFSKIEAGRFEVASDPVELHRLLGEEIETFRNLAAKAGCELEHHIDAAVPTCIVGDDLRLRQVLNNLLANAIKFSSGQSRAGRIELRTSLAGPGRLEITIADNGIGIDAATQARLFRPFEQADPGTTKRYGGTGLGLTITRHLVELMGGTIQLHSEPGAGSTFVIRLPLRRCADVAAPSAPAGNAPIVTAPDAAECDKAGSTAAPPPDGTATTARRRVLVAEDNETNREVIRLQLARCGVDADFATDGAQALDLFRSGCYTLLLSDLHMPQLDGFALARAVRKFEHETGRAPATLVAVTAAAHDADLLRAREAGMDTHLVKPIRLEALREALQRWGAGDADAPGPAQPAHDDASEAADDATTAPRVDLDVLRELVGDDPDTVRALVRQYAAELAATAAAMLAARVPADARTLGDLAHRLKSSSRSVGALALGELCASIEHAGRSGDAAALAALLPAFEREVAAVQRELRTATADATTD
ncbi:autoinducer 2 sensor kinase/phosphatase LuxQ [mine drainage metagenome]|uniref:histidine kinase n=1 Tax=mine drainage metagenome TaxID=410659 RepID=A0A1J5R1K7_9ZZZZ